MKKLLLLLSLLCSMHSSLLAETLSFKDYDKKSILILGDSITQRGHYVNFLEYYLRTQAADLKIDLLSIGYSGEKALLKANKTVHSRLENILSAKKFDLVIACYGMNDGLYHPFSEERFQNYKEGIQSLADKLSVTGAKVVFMTPTLFENKSTKRDYQESNGSDFTAKTAYIAYDDVLAKFSAFIKSLPYPSIDLRTALLKEKAELIKEDPNFLFSKDAIHPDALGNLVMARTIAQYFSLDLPATNLKEELKRISKDKRFAQIKKYRGQRSGRWLKYSIKGDKKFLNGVEESYSKAYEAL